MGEATSLTGAAAGVRKESSAIKVALLPNPASRPRHPDFQAKADAVTYRSFASAARYYIPYDLVSPGAPPASVRRLDTKPSPAEVATIGLDYTVTKDPASRTQNDDVVSSSLRRMPIPLHPADRVSSRERVAVLGQRIGLKTEVPAR